MGRDFTAGRLEALIRDGAPLKRRGSRGDEVFVRLAPPFATWVAVVRDSNRGEDERVVVTVLDDSDTQPEAADVGPLPEHKRRRRWAQRRRRG